MTPKVIAWEITRNCAMNCKHCRGSAREEDYSGELTTDECKLVINNISKESEISNLRSEIILILTGGEPMSRPDIYEIARYASEKGLHVVMAPCGHLITPETTKKIKGAGTQAVSISIDGASAEAHDEFRGSQGAFAKTMEGLRYLTTASIPFQINTTVTKHNIRTLPEIHTLACELGAKTLDLFFLVPTGRGAELKDLELSPEEYESTLQWVRDLEILSPINIKTTCAPHYTRIKGTTNDKPASSGCMAGRGFVFISHTGILQPCGFFDMPCGDLRKADYDFMNLYESSEVFSELGNTDNYLGKCGICGYKTTCGGCRARALAHTGNYMESDPSCSYKPTKT